MPAIYNYMVSKNPAETETMNIDLSAENEGKIPEVLIRGNEAVQCYPFWAESREELKELITNSPKISI